MQVSNPALVTTLECLVVTTSKRQNCFKKVRVLLGTAARWRDHLVHEVENASLTVTPIFV